MSPVEWLSLAIAVGSIFVALIVIFIMRTGKKEEPEKSAEVPESEPEGPPAFKIRKSVTQKEVEDTKNRMRILSLEREILSYAIRRLYEAQAEGNISEGERDGLAEKYKEDMKRINEDITRGESIVALSELERMQEDLLKLFDERFGELSKRIEELRTRSGIEPIEPPGIVEEGKPALAEPSEAAASVQERKRREIKEKKPAVPEKSEAERKVEQIMAEVEKVLARLEQMEVSE